MISIKTIDTNYDDKLEVILEKRLKRKATISELTNADNDSDIVNETMWQIMKEQEARIISLEEALKSGIIKQ